MGKTNEFKDDFLKGMFKQSSLDVPSDKFTKLVMDRIQVEVVEQSEADKPIIEMKYWLLIGMGLAVAAYMLFQMDWSFMQGVFGAINIKPIAFPELPKVSLSMFGGLQKFISSIHIPTIFIVAVVAVISLITLDQVLKKNQYSTKLFFF